MKKRFFIFAFLFFLFSVLTACEYDLDALSQNVLGSNVPAKSTETITDDLATGELEVTFLDVGQGDSIFILLPNGETMLIDAGEAQAVRESVIPWLQEQSVQKIDYLVATHPHADHIGGMAEIIRTFDIESIFMPGVSHTTKTFENMLDAIEEKGLEIQIAAAGELIFDFGNLDAIFLAPNRDNYKDLNNYSAVLRLRYGSRSFLFMGDAEKQSEAEILATHYDLSAHVLKVGHHGSDTSSTSDFLKAVHPRFAVISLGEENSYGHPHSSTLETLEDMGVEVLRTDQRGNITFISDEKTLEWRSEK